MIGFQTDPNFEHWSGWPYIELAFATGLMGAEDWTHCCHRSRRTRMRFGHAPSWYPPNLLQKLCRREYEPNVKLKSATTPGPCSRKVLQPGCSKSGEMRHFHVGCEVLPCFLHAGSEFCQGARQSVLLVSLSTSGHGRSTNFAAQCLDGDYAKGNANCVGRGSESKDKVARF